MPTLTSADAAPATELQATYIEALIRRGAHTTPGAPKVPATAAGIRALTRDQAHKIIHALHPGPVCDTTPARVRVPQAPEVTVRTTSSGLTRWDLHAPAAPGSYPETHDVHADPAAALRALLAAARATAYCTEHAPQGWTVDGMEPGTTTLGDGTYPLRPLPGTDQ